MSSYRLEDEIYNNDYALFHRPFSASVQNLYNVTKSQLEDIGIPYTGDKDKDRGYMHDYVQRLMTINDMVEFYDAGATIYLTNPHDSVTVYAILEKHMSNWRQVKQEMFNMQMPPEEDFVKIDRFMAALHPVMIMNRDGIHVTQRPNFGIDDFINRIQGTGGVFALPAFKGFRQSVDEDPDIVDKSVLYQSMLGDLLSNMGAGDEGVNFDDLGK